MTEAEAWKTTINRMLAGEKIHDGLAGNHPIVSIETAKDCGDGRIELTYTMRAPSGDYPSMGFIGDARNEEITKQMLEAQE